ncbi:MAG: efflux RND transporter periplasmic adaptor subunit [Syntrophobacteraceae bacterium]|nr:efflux RND transporter periplasmic adaptor subunit [Syntrophobacteraceae bacterium]
MVRKYMLPLLSALGVLFAIWMVMEGSRPIIHSQPVADPPRVEFASRISGAGIVEASTRNISIGAHLPGIVARVNVEVGQRVKAGAPLFSIDDRAAIADLAVREARVQETEANLQDLKAQLRIAESIKDPRAISIEDLNKRRYAVKVAEARVATASAEVRAARVDLDRLTVRAPIDGTVLQSNIRPGEYAPSGVTAQPLMLLGSLDRVHVRVDIDENDAWRFNDKAPAIAFVRGNPALRTTLRFEYIEKYVIPKRSLTGESTERVDTRVMQAVYSFNREDLPVFPGQLMDVFIEDLSSLTTAPQEADAPAKRP